MGDRGSIEVKSESEELEDVYLYLHWGGDEKSVIKWVTRAYAEIFDNRSSNSSSPYTRGEEGAVLALLTKISVDSLGFSAYLAMKDRGNDSDNGHYVLYTKEDKWKLEHHGRTIWASNHFYGDKEK